MPNYAESVAIREAFLRSLTDLEDSATQPMIRAYTQALERIEADIRKSLDADNALGEALRESFTGAEDTARVAVIRGRSEFIAAQFDRFVENGSTAIRVLAPNAYRLGVDAATQQVGTVAANVTTPNRRAIEQAAARYLPGTVQREWLEGFARESTQQVVDDLVSSTVLGENPNRVAMRVRKHGTMGTTRIRTFVHTETLGAARAGISDLYRDNSDILQGWIWNAEETSQTCEVCWAMNGTQHDLSEDLDSHPNCRCVQEPMTKTWEQLSEEFGDDFADVPETAARPFDPDERFRSVLSPDEQLRVMGAGKYALYRDGKIRLADLVTPTVSDKWGRGLRATTLRELRERGVESASVLDQVANATPTPARAAAQPSPVTPLAELDGMINMFDVGRGNAQIRQSINAVIDALDGLHGVRRDITWRNVVTVKDSLGRDRLTLSEERARLPIYIRRESKTGEGGHISSRIGQPFDDDGVLRLVRGDTRYIEHIVVRPHSAGGMLEPGAAFTHEVGHYADYILLPRIVSTGSATNSRVAWRLSLDPDDVILNNLIDNREIAEAMAEVFKRARATDTWDALRSIESQQVMAYMTEPEEMFARIYTQWAAQRTGDRVLVDALRAEQSKPRVLGRTNGLFAWTNDEFDQIGEAMDELFRVAGMLR